MRIHPITGMTLEDGSGALSDDEQALRIHIPFIEHVRGKAIADAMRDKILPPPPAPPPPPPAPVLVKDTAAEKLTAAIHDLVVETAHEAVHGD